MFHAPFPWYVQLMWFVLGGFMIAGAILAYINQRKADQQEETKPKKKEKYDPQDPSIDIEPFNFDKKNQWT